VGDEHTVLIPTLGITHIEITPAQLEVLAHAELIYSTPVEFDLLRCGAMDSLAIIDYCRARGAKMVYDIDVDYLQDGAEERFTHLDIAFFNQVGFDRYRGDLAQQDAVAQLLAHGLELVVVTLAEQGCIVFAPHETVQVPGTGRGRGRRHRLAIRFVVAFCMLAPKVMTSRLPLPLPMPLQHYVWLGWEREQARWRRMWWYK
jgi:sugar/nucleoside kinase (ribokinase family)